MKDCHIHFMPMPGPIDSPEVFMEKTKLAGVDGGALFSLPPATFKTDPERPQTWEFRLEHVLEYAEHSPGFLPFFWCDPTEQDASRQIKTAVEKGIRGFKFICNHYPADSQLDKFSQIAEARLPVQFHSGILFDHYESSNFNRPTSFECLSHVPGLKFSLAHMAWPWCDEYIAVFGKIAAAQAGKEPKRVSTMFVDLTPGTPIIYRREALRKLYLTGYNLGTRVLWGSDSVANHYSYENIILWTKLDREIMDGIAKEWKTNSAFELMSSQCSLDDIFIQSTEKNFLEFYGR